jgi:HEPN domain-containing protein
MNEDELKAKEVNGYLDIAQEFLESAQTSFNRKRYKVTVDHACHVAGLCARLLPHLIMEFKNTRLDIHTLVSEKDAQFAIELAETMMELLKKLKAE